MTNAERDKVEAQAKRRLKMDKPILKLVFAEPRDGCWDGGRKSSGEFYPNGEHPGKGGVIRWDCFELNFWFSCGCGRSWREAASIAKRRLYRMIGVPAYVEIIWEEVK